VFTPRLIDEPPGVFHARRIADIAFGATQVSAGGSPTPPDPANHEDRAQHGELWVPKLSSAKTLVLGSSQPTDSVDSTALRDAGVAITSRRSGGGAVLVSAEDLVWFDVIIDDTHPHWDPDVSRSFEWLGRACQDALADFDIHTSMHTGRLQSSKWSSLICFAGLGPGELAIDGRKVVGMSQRRTRNRARFQVAILRRWSGAEHASFLAPHIVTPEAPDELERVAVGLPHSPTDLLGAVVERLNA